MESNNKPFNGYKTGADMWRDTVSSYGIDEAVKICSNYLDMNLKRQLSDSKKDFSRELFRTVYEATASKPNHIKIVYPYTLEEADKRWESSYYHQSRDINQECSRAITKTANDSCFETNFYNLEVAAWVVLLKYGFNRVGAVLAHQIQRHKSDGRYSWANKQWAQSFILPDRAFEVAFMNAHACLVDGIADYVRKLYVSMGAERYALPGQEERGEVVHGYEIIRAVVIDNDTGYALAHNPDAIDPFVCWQFKVRDDRGRSYNWGTYGCEQAAIDSYHARVFIHTDAETDNNNP